MRRLAPTIVVLGLGALLAVLLAPLANRLQRIMRSRALTAMAVVVLLLVPFVAILGWLVTTVQREVQALLTNLPGEALYFNGLLQRWQASLAGAGVSVDLAGTLQRNVEGILAHSLNALSRVASVTADTVVVLVVAFFLIWDGEALTASAYALLPRNWQGTAQEVGRILSSTVSDYVRGQVIVGTVFGVLVGGSMSLLGLPDAVLLGFLAGLFELLPSVGPILGAVAPVGVALSQGGHWTHVLWVVLVLIGAQQLESNVLVPRISGGAVGLHPLTVIVAVFAGWNLGGLNGAILAVPAAGVARELVRRWWRPSLPPRSARRWPAPAVSAVRPAPDALLTAPPNDPGPVPSVRAVPPAPPAPKAETPRARRRQRGSAPG